MPQPTKIEWTWTSWNPLTGCSKVSVGCQNCYAERMALRLQKMGNKKYKRGFKVTPHYDLIKQPLSWKKPQVIFVNSMSDLFHEDVSDDFVIKMFDTMNQAHWHTFQILTKRSKRLAKIASDLHWSENIWMGVTVETSKQLFRLTDLGNVPASIRFVSMEPLLGHINDFPVDNLDWVIVGGESGPKKKKKYIFKKHKTVFYITPGGGLKKNTRGRLLDGKYWDEIPSTKDLDLKLSL